MTRKNADLLTGPVLPGLLRFALPILASLLLQAMYGAVDLWMVSRFARGGDISAVATGSQTMMIVNGIVTGLSMGLTILLGQAVGEKDHHRCGRIIGTAAGLFSVLALVLTAVLLLAAPGLAAVLNAPAQALDRTVRYIRICGAGTIFIVAFNVLSGIFCGLGDSRTPLRFVAIACVVNVAGDAVLIRQLDLGAEGAAAATAAAQAVSVLLALGMLRRQLPFTLERKHFRIQGGLAGKIVRLGAPIALQNLCNELSYLLIIGLVNALGITASAGVGIAEKLVMFILLVPTAYLSAISAAVAQNVGAQQPARAVRTLWVGLAAAMVSGGVLAFLSFFHGDALSRLFISDPAVIAASAEFLQATAIECFLLSGAYCFMGYFNGLGRTGFVMAQGLCAVLLVRMPFAVWASRRPAPTLFGIGCSMAWAALFMLCACGGRYLLHCLSSRR